MQKVGDALIDSVIGDNIPIFTEQEKFNETVTSSIKRLEAQITGTMTSLCSCCFGSQENCPYTELFLLRGATAVSMQ